MNKEMNECSSLYFTLEYSLIDLLFNISFQHFISTIFSAFCLNWKLHQKKKNIFGNTNKCRNLEVHTHMKHKITHKLSLKQYQVASGEKSHKF